MRLANWGFRGKLSIRRSVALGSTSCNSAAGNGRLTPITSIDPHFINQTNRLRLVIRLNPRLISPSP